jgi:hypothetical protein
MQFFVEKLIDHETTVEDGARPFHARAGHAGCGPSASSVADGMGFTIGENQPAPPSAQVRMKSASSAVLALRAFLTKNPDAAQPSARLS